MKRKNIVVVLLFFSVIIITYVYFIREKKIVDHVKEEKDQAKITAGKKSIKKDSLAGQKARNKTTPIVEVGAEDDVIDNQDPFTRRTREVDRSVFASYMDNDEVMIEDDFYMKLFDDVEIKASKTKVSQLSKHIKIWKGYTPDNQLSKQLHEHYTNVSVTIDDHLNIIVISASFNGFHYSVRPKPSNKQIYVIREGRPKKLIHMEGDGTY